MSKRSTTHSTFVIERDYGASAARVFAAWADKSAKGQWFGPSEGEHQLDFREGGREHLLADVHGAVYTYDALYEDIVPDERIVFTYNMHRDGKRMSVSVTTVELLPAVGEKTRLRYVEQGVFLDGEDTPEAREQGTKELLDKLGEALRQGAAV
jgi:uncharacterized protein YndB with AHSA1/START domain